MSLRVTVTYPDDRVGLIEFGDPPMNFGTLALDDLIVEGLDQVQQAGCSVVVVASSTPRYFMAHWDLQWLLGAFASAEPPVRTPRMFESFERSPLISIATINGQCWGAGAEFAWGCDVRIAGESATFAQPEVAIGLIPGGGGTSRLARLVGHARCLELLIDGGPISADRALLWGAVNRVVPDASLLSEAISWASRLARWSPSALAACKESALAGRDMPVREARRAEGQIFWRLSRQPETELLVKAAAERYLSGEESRAALQLNESYDS